VTHGVLFFYVVFGFSHSSSCHPIGERFGLMKVKIAWEESLSTGFFKKRSGNFWGENLPLVTSFFGSVIIAGRERKSFCGAFKA
jgi:hypothetical protein